MDFVKERFKLQLRHHELQRSSTYNGKWLFFLAWLFSDKTAVLKPDLVYEMHISVCISDCKLPYFSHNGKEYGP